MAKLGSGPGQCDSKPALLIMTLETEREQLSQGHSVSKSFIGTGVTQHVLAEKARETPGMFYYRTYV